MGALGTQPSALTFGKCFMTHITTGCSDGIFTREKLFSSKSSSFLYLEKLAQLSSSTGPSQKQLPACLSPGRKWLKGHVSTNRRHGRQAPPFRVGMGSQGDRECC